MADKKQTKDTPQPTEAAPEHPEPNRLPSDQLVVTGDTDHPEVPIEGTNKTELADPKDEDNYAGGPEYKPV